MKLKFKRIISIVSATAMLIITLGCEESKQMRIPMIRVNGELYLETSCINISEIRSENPDGIVISKVDSSEIPVIDNQSNFSDNLKYQFGVLDGTIEVYVEEFDYWLIYATEEARESNNFVGEINLPHQTD